MLTVALAIKGPTRSCGASYQWSNHLKGTVWQCSWNAHFRLPRQGPRPLDCKITNIGAPKCIMSYFTWGAPYPHAGQETLKCIMAYFIQGPLVLGQIHPYLGGLVKGLHISSVHWTLDHEAQMWDLRGPLSLKGVQMASVQGPRQGGPQIYYGICDWGAFCPYFWILSRGFKCRLCKLTFEKEKKTPY